MAVELGSYVLDEIIGSGTSGQVWRGRSRQSQQQVAVKLLRPELGQDPAVLDRFLRERGILVKLKDPNVVSFVDVVAGGGQIGIVMQLVAGGDLRRYFNQRGRLDAPDVCALLAQVADGLAAAHAHGIVHRDLKPENILVDTESAGAPRPRITDFGIARIINEPALTQRGQILGTPLYMAPEVTTDGATSSAADIYALGIIAYELLSGRPPFVDESPWVILELHRVGVPPRPDGIPDELWRMIATCLDKEPARRPTATEVAQALRAQAPASQDQESGVVPVGAERGASTVSLTESTSASSKPLRRRPLVVATSLGVAVVTSAAAISLALGVGRGAPSPERSSAAVPPVTAPPAPVHTFLLDMDQGIQVDASGRRYVGDASGHGHLGYLRTAGDGDLALLPRDGGRAVRFPGRCPATESASCPRVIIEIANAPGLDPGTEDFSFGADVLVTPDQARSSDILRKGYVAGERFGQWRLQLEPGGRVSCAVTGNGRTEIHVVSSTQSVVDGAWHRVRCFRSGASLAVEVDGVTPEVIAIPAGLAIESRESVVVGGYSANQQLNQFFGTLDNVYMSVP